MNPSILVTGATGNVGAEVLRLLSTAGMPARGATSGTRPPPALDHVTWVRLDFAERSTWPGALEGIRQVFLVRPPQISNMEQTLLPFLDACRQAGVEHVVFLSLLGVESNPWVPHRKVEDHLARSGMKVTSLRPSFFMQNLSTTHREDLARDRTIVVPGGRGKTSFIDARDVAAAGARALLEPAVAGRPYALTGSQALDYFQVAEAFTRVLGVPVRYTNPSAWAFLRHMRRAGHPLAFILVMEALYLVCRLGRAGRVTDEVDRLLGRPPILLEQFIRDHAECWRPAP